MELRPKGIVRTQLKQANIAEDYWDLDFSNYEGSEKAAHEAMLYLTRLYGLKEQGIGLLLAGKPGTGKTSLGAITLKYLVKYNWNCYMTSLSEIIEEIKRSWDKNEEADDFLRKCKEADFLFIDDVGKEHMGPTGFSSVVFDNLLRHRIQHRLPTILTTNLNRTAIKERYGDALLSLVEGKCKVVEVNGSDYRATKQKSKIA